jgi:pilus assembly protein Flp/PilA
LHEPGSIFDQKFLAQSSLLEGQGLVEYALVLFLVAIVALAVLALLGPQIGNVYSRIQNQMPF